VESIVSTICSSSSTNSVNKNKRKNKRRNKMSKATAMKSMAIGFVLTDIGIAAFCFDGWSMVTFLSFGAIGYILGNSK
jgi:hypothetical protein